MEIVEKLIDINPYSRPGKKLDSKIAIIMHWVGRPGQSDLIVRDYFQSLSTQDPGDTIPDIFASAHYVVDVDGSIIRLIPDDEVAYHCGAASYTDKAKEIFGDYYTSNASPNRVTIGIELCHPRWDGFDERTTLAASELCAGLCLEYEMDPLVAIWRHNDVTGKDCPAPWVLEPKRFEMFKDHVVALVKP